MSLLHPEDGFFDVLDRLLELLLEVRTAWTGDALELGCLTDLNEVELHAGNDTVVFTMSEEVMKQLHKKLGDKLTELAASRIEEAHKLTQEESSDDE